MDDDMGIPAHLLIAQHQRWTIFKTVINLFSICFQPILNLFSAHLHPVAAYFSIYFSANYYSTYNIQPIIIAHTTNIQPIRQTTHFQLHKNSIQQHIRSRRLPESATQSSNSFSNQRVAGFRGRRLPESQSTIVIQKIIIWS